MTGAADEGRIRLKRVYQRAAETDGARYLVERLWPRGVKKSELALDGWLKDLAPSPGLRTWFGHEPVRWSEFQRRYFGELDSNQAAVEPLLQAARRGPVTLLFSARDLRHNNAVALRTYLERKLG